MALPLSKNPLFTGREMLVAQIHDNLTSAPSHHSHVESTVVLFGLGGIGKTQLAVQYAYLFSNHYSCVWWIDMTNKDRFLASLVDGINAFVDALVQKLSTHGALIDFSKIALNLGLPPNGLGEVGRLSIGQACNPQMIMRAFKRLLSSDRSKPWLAILDNYDDPESVDITQALPTNGFGSVIVTTRLTDQQIHGFSIEVDEIDEESGLQLLVKTSRRDIHKLKEEGRHCNDYFDGTSLTGIAMQISMMLESSYRS